MPRRDSRLVLEGLPPPPAGARLSYGDEPLQFGDLRLPAAEGPHPLLVVVHGGYWKAFVSLTYAGHLCRGLAAEGIATWNVEYRRIGDVGGGWPGTLDDVRQALDHVAVLAHDYPLDRERVALFGHSAGAHLALAAARSAPVRGVVAAAPVTDLEAAWRRTAGSGAVELLLGGSPEEVPERYFEASPIRRLPLGVPHVLVHGTADDAVPYEESVAYAAAAAGEAGLVTLERAGHFEPVDPLAAEWHVVLGLIRGALS